MTKTKKVYYLLNEQRCFFGSCVATSLRSARATFSKKYSGNFIIESHGDFYGEHMKVNL